MPASTPKNIFKQFIEAEASGGILLLVCVLVSLTLANSALYPNVERLLTTSIGVENDTLHLRYTVLQWINDGLMAVFFLMVGLEIKREIIKGELSDLRHAGLPVVAAVGGAAVPAMIFWLLNRNTEAANGWGIPMATDIAFALGILSLLGKRVPPSLKIFLAALAIADDLIAILIIALFYSAALHLNYLFYSAGVFACMLVLNKLKVKSLVFYLIPGLLLWYFIHRSGIHPTIAGVLTAISIPVSKHSADSPLEKLEHALARPVNFLIMPVFALANTNIRFSSSMLDGLTNPLGMGIVLGLLLGKPLGISLSSWLMVKFRLVSLPRQANWTHIIGVGLLGGIGFTMSIFISLLSFSTPSFQGESKFAVLVTSTVAGVLGFLMLSATSRKRRVGER